MEKVLLTGGMGYIGSHTAILLMQGSWELVIADNLSNSEIGVLDNIEKINGKRPCFENVDLADPKACSDLFARHPDIVSVIHFAALKAVGESVHEALRYYNNNLKALLNVLSEMEKYSIKKFVFSSSCTVYGQPKSLPVTEQTPLQEAQSPYGNTKKIAEEILRDLALSNKIQCICLRYFNPIGAHPSGLIGELPYGIPNNLMPFITQTAIGKRDVLKVFGNDYPTPDGTPIRDYIHVCDLAEAHIRALTYMESTPLAIDYFNVGTGNGFSVLEVIESFERVSSCSLPYQIAPRRIGDIPEIWADTHKVEKLLGWKASYTLDDMTADAWRWEKNLAEKH